MEPSLTARVLVAGAGISGAACASVLRAAGVEVTVRDTSSVTGGRMYSPRRHERVVDLGAGYFTVSDGEFASVVDRWTARGLVRPWTDTFTVFDHDGRSEAAGPQRWVAGDGMSSLVDDLHTGAVEFAAPVTMADRAYDATVFAVPDPQAAAVLGDVCEWVEFESVIAVAAGWDRREWDLSCAAFVNDDPTITLIADDGSRRGDAAAVLVAHTTSALANEHLGDPTKVVAPVVDTVRRLLAIGSPPLWTDTTVWRHAKPSGTHGDAPFLLDGQVGVCGDSWCPSGSPRVEAAWLSGHRLGHELATRLS